MINYCLILCVWIIIVWYCVNEFICNHNLERFEDWTKCFLNSRLRIFPEAVFGIESTNATRLIFLYGETFTYQNQTKTEFSIIISHNKIENSFIKLLIYTWQATNSITCDSPRLLLGRLTTIAIGTWPDFSSGYLLINKNKQEFNFIFTIHYKSYKFNDPYRPRTESQQRRVYPGEIEAIAQALPGQPGSFTSKIQTNQIWPLYFFYQPNLISVDFDQLFQPIDDVEISFAVDIAKIACPKPSFSWFNSRGFRFSVPDITCDDQDMITNHSWYRRSMYFFTFHDGRSSNPKLSLFSRWQSPSRFVVHDFCFVSWAKLSWWAVSETLFRAGHPSHGPGWLGQPISLHHGNEIVSSSHNQSNYFATFYNLVTSPSL